MEINSVLLHHVDIQANTVTPIEIDESSVNLNNYVESLVDEIHNNPNRRKYQFKDGNTQVKTTLVPILQNGEGLNEIILNNAKRLLEKEKKSQERIARLLLGV